MYDTQSDKCKKCKYRFSCVLDQFDVVEVFHALYFNGRIDSVRISQTPHTPPFLRTDVLPLRFMMHLESSFNDVPALKNGRWQDVMNPPENNYYYVTETLGGCRHRMISNADGAYDIPVVVNDRISPEYNLDWVMFCIKLVAHLSNYELCGDIALSDVIIKSPFWGEFAKECNTTFSGNET